MVSFHASLTLTKFQRNILQGELQKHFIPLGMFAQSEARTLSLVTGNNVRGYYLDTWISCLPFAAFHTWLPLPSVKKYVMHLLATQGTILYISVSVIGKQAA